MNSGDRAGSESWAHFPPGQPVHPFDQCVARGHHDPRDPAAAENGIPRIIRDQTRQTERVAVEWKLAEWADARWSRFLELLFTSRRRPA